MTTHVLRERDWVVEHLNIAPATLDSLVGDRLIIELSQDGERVYPQVQFSEDGLDAVFLAALGSFKKTSFTGDEIWSFLGIPMPTEDPQGGESILDYLTRTRDFQRVGFALSYLIDLHWLSDASTARTDWGTPEDPSRDFSYKPQRRGGNHGS